MIAPTVALVSYECRQRSLHSNQVSDSEYEDLYLLHVGVERHCSDSILVAAERPLQRGILRDGPLPSHRHPSPSLKNALEYREPSKPVPRIGGRFGCIVTASGAMDSGS
jgi:hypothetical protein